jgi:hypothetical protein
MPDGPGVSPSSSLSAWCRQRSKSGQRSYICGSYSVCRLFFHFGGGQALHNFLTLIFHSLTKVLTVCFAISSPTVCLKVLLSVLLLPRHNHSFTPRFLMSLLHSSCARCLFWNVRPFEVPLVTVSLPGP